MRQRRSSCSSVLPAATATDLWEISGVPLSALDPLYYVARVDAALAGLDLGEKAHDAIPRRQHLISQILRGTLGNVCILRSGKPEPPVSPRYAQSRELKLS